MPMHDWTKVPDGTYHAHHFRWIGAIEAYLNNGHLPDDYYAEPEQRTHGYEPDMVALKLGNGSNSGNGTAVLPKPKTRFHQATDQSVYRRKQNVVAVRHVSGNRLVAVVEIVSPGNKSSKNAFEKFQGKALEWLKLGIHMLIIDPFPPTKRDPKGIHHAIWEVIDGKSDIRAPKTKPLSLVSYECSEIIEAYVEPFAVGDKLKDMPLFLEPDFYVNVPLEQTYMSAFALMPKPSRVGLEK